MSNWATLSGRLGKDPIVRYTQNGIASLFITIACNNKPKPDGSKVNPDWIPVKAFGPMAEKIKNRKKGDLVFLEGPIKTDTWESKSGEKKSMTYVLAVKETEQTQKVNKDYDNVPDFDDSFL